MFIAILLISFSSLEEKKGRHERYPDPKIHNLNFDHCHVHEYKQNIKGQNNLKHVRRFMKNMVKKVQKTIRIAIDFINNGKPFNVNSKRLKMLSKLIYT